MSLSDKNKVGYIVVYRNAPRYKGMDVFLKFDREHYSFKECWENNRMVLTNDINAATVFPCKQDAQRIANANNQPPDQAHLPAEAFPIYQERRLIVQEDERPILERIQEVLVRPRGP